jgi:hypothetical protein
MYASAVVRRLARLLLVGALTVGITTSSLAALRGERNKLHPLLGEILDPLHKKGIDVVGGDTSEVPLGRRPRVAELAGMPTLDANVDWDSVPWMKDFRSGTAGFVAAAKTDTRAPGPLPKDEFLARWQQVAQDRRIFLSFTSKDLQLAHATEGVLREHGYVTFMFLRSGDEGPRYDATLVGKLFTEAEHHFVIDTRNARRSPGVFMEASFAKHMGGGGNGGGRPEPGPPARPSSPGGKEWAGPAMEKFVKGVQGRWVVTENPDHPGKLFVHRKSEGGFLVDPMYLMKVGPDGSWTVYEPNPTGGGLSYGRRLGRMKEPPSVEIGPCGCR